MGLALSKQEEYQNMVGMKIGHRLLLSLMDKTTEKNKNHNRYFWSRCDCGKEARVLAAEIIQGRRTHCGCLNEKKFIDLTGMKFGHWTVLSRADNKIVPATGSRPHGQNRPLTMWHCRCDCGTESINYGNNLRNNRTHQCQKCKIKELLIRRAEYYTNGGKSAENIHGRSVYRDHSMTARYNSIKHAAEKRNKLWDISIDVYRELAIMNCFYCNAPPDQVSHGKHAIAVNGMDRYDNDLGYCERNVVTCCKLCNHLKGNMHGDDFLKIIFRVADFNS